MSSEVSPDPNDLAKHALGRGELAIEARGLGKIYPLYDRPQDRLKQMLWPGRKRFYREFVAVRGVDLEVGRGECVGVVGRNGSGKSTLLNIICGTLSPTEGQLRVRGRVAPMLALGAGFSPEFTGRENVELNATVQGTSPAVLRERMESIVEFADIGDFFDQPVKRYSSGMYSRLAFAAAIAASPEILVMDEVLAVGDEAFTRKCFARIEAIKDEGATIFFASHAPNLIHELCNRAILMDGGECLLQADPKTVVAQHQRLLYARPEETDAIRKDVRRIGALPEGERAAAAARSLDGVRVVVPADTGRFDPGLQPESTQTYGVGGARIRDLRILDPSGRPVNLLRPGQPYRYAYEVDFDENAEHARFGMMIKIVTGFELAGQVSAPRGQSLAKIDAGETVSVEFTFEARLVPGTYFLNAGVLAADGEEEVYLHRVMDGLMFKVLPEEGSRVTGLADLTDGEEKGRTIVRVAPPAHC
jgi:lipopolysaccharide transport system ATP-binding protein